MFLAHEVADLAREELWSQLRPYREQFPDSRWTQARSWHLTLLFLGEVSVDEIGALKQLADFAAARADGPFRVTARLGGGRARRGDGVAWLGTHMVLIAMALMIADHNRLTILKKW